MKLTNDEIENVFAMYWNSEFLYSGEVGTIVKVKYMRGNYSIEKCKLLVTALDKITDEHAIEVAKIIINEKFSIGFKTTLSMNLYSDYYEIALSFDSLDFTCFYQHFKTREKRPISFTKISGIFQYFASKGYSVPLFFGLNHWANGKTPIELGIGINKDAS